MQIHASDYEHVLLLLDGVRLNDIDAGFPESTGIPVQIIDRIVVVKGPASSAWGSALGGVINIVTKKAGNNRRLTGTLYSSYGEGPSMEYRADAAWSAARFGHYLYGGYMDSDGLLDDRYFTSKSFYGKTTADLVGDISLTFAAGYWYPDEKDYDLPDYDLNYTSDVENYLGTGKMAAGLAPDWRLDLEMYYRGQNWYNHFTTLSRNWGRPINYRQKPFSGPQRRGGSSGRQQA